ncbi:MAG: arginine--tRNA ligase [Thermoplasmataceae archaeon]
MLLFEDYRKRLTESLKSLYPEIKDNDIAPDRTGHADLALRAFSLLRKGDVKIEDVVSKITGALSGEDYIDSITSSGGYVNFVLNTGKLMEAISSEIYGTDRFPDVFQDPERVSVEHTSTNPTGPIHIGRIRNSIIGDSLFRILSRYGYRVTTQYFVNDSGRQVASLYVGYKKFGQNDPLTTDNLLKAYQRMHREVEANPDLEKEVDETIREYEAGKPQVMDDIRKICSVILGSINETLERLGIKIDDYTWESDLIRNGDVNKILEALEDELEDEGGAKYVSSGSRKMFLTRNDGTSLYFSRDIAYHQYKMDNFDWIIDVLGENHKEHAGHIKYVIKDVLHREGRLDFVFYSYVSLESGKMTTRGGNIVTADELLDRAIEESLKIVKDKRPELPESDLMRIALIVATSAVRFHIVKLNSNKQMIFKWAEALSLEGDSAPFVMYSYARAASILRKAGNTEVIPKTGYSDLEAPLVKKMYEYAYVLHDAAYGLKPEAIANYLLELTRVFNDFYTNCPVLNADSPDRNRRLAIVKNFKNIVKDAAYLVGINVLEEM